MGKFDGKYLRGAVGAMIFKKVRGQQIVQGKSKKKRIKQSADTKKAATIFGKASSLASYIRVALNKTIGFYDGAMISRLTGEVNQIFHSSVTPEETQTLNLTSADFDRLNGFEFNISSTVRNQIFVQPLVSTTDNLLHIDLPEMNIPKDLKFPANGSYCVLGFEVALIDLRYGHYKAEDIQTFEIKYKYQPATIPPRQFTFQTEPGCLCIITIALHYYEKTFSGNSVVNNKTFNPSAILKAFILTGTIDKAVTKKWQPMSFKVK